MDEFNIPLEIACKILGVKPNSPPNEVHAAFKKVVKKEGSAPDAKNFLDQCRRIVIEQGGMTSVSETTVDPKEARRQRNLAAWKQKTVTLHCLSGGGKTFIATRYMNFEKKLTFIEDARLPEEEARVISDVRASHSDIVEQGETEELEILKTEHPEHDDIMELLEIDLESPWACPHCERTHTFHCNCGESLCWNPKIDGDIVCPVCRTVSLKENQMWARSRAEEKPASHTALDGQANKLLETPRKSLPPTAKRIGR